MTQNKIQSNGKKRVHVTTLGCSKNLYDSEILMGQLQANGVPILEDPQEADIIILNTCGFITPAKEESIQAIMEASELKKEKPDMHLLVCGCLSARYAKTLVEKIPEVDAYFGTEKFTDILNYLNLEVKSPKHLYEQRYISQKSHYAYLKISEGCNHKCAFCAIPLMRGQHKSRPMEDIVREAQLLAQKNVKEIILIAQDTTFYGLDLYKKQQIMDLLIELEKINGIEWIRIHYAYPTTFQDKLIDLIRGSNKIVHYIDLPIQHISDNILRIMKRGGTSKRIRKILLNLRKQIPDIAMRTTFLVGHPGETEKDFLELLNFTEEFQFDRLGLFTYSAEENTAAYKLSAPSQKIAEQRYNKIMSLQQKISLKKNQAKIDKTFPVIIDEINSENNTALGRTYADSPEIDNDVIIQNISQTIKTGQFYNIKISDAAEYTLFGYITEKQ